MAEAWRIVKAHYGSCAFSGEGAARFGGRWNSRGSWVVYTSGSQSLAALEILVHLNPRMHFDYLAFRIEFDDALVKKVDSRLLPPNWRDSPAPPATRVIGDDWLRAGRGAILQLPSVVVPSEFSYLLSPEHSDFSKIRMHKPVPFSFDARLLD